MTFWRLSFPTIFPTAFKYGERGCASIRYFYIGIFRYASFFIWINVSKTLPSLWVLDSRATDHMTPSFKYFSTYSPCPSNKKIATADCTLVIVACIGNIKINPFVTLKSVLHVPKLSTNLVSIQKVTNGISCIIIFYDHCCVFQDKESGRTIGRARERNGLYLLEESCVPVLEENQSHSFML